MSIFFTADHHFHHWSSPDRNIIKYCRRPFTSIEDMNETLIDLWNKKVKDTDTVYHMGDFSFGNTAEILSRLNGHKIFTLGDHDSDLERVVKQNNPAKTTIHNKQVLQVKHDNINVFCLHWCMRAWPQSHYNSWHLYGHSHGRLEPIGKSWDVGVDNCYYEPLSWDEIVQIMKNRPDNPNLIKKRE